MFPPREKVLVVMPSHDRRIDIACMSGLAQCGKYFDRPVFLTGVSNVAYARNELAHMFVEKATQYDWLMHIDSDIGFTVEDWEILWEGDEDIVTQEYAKKVIGEQPAQCGLGFTRVHRRVFEMMKELQSEDGREVVQRYYSKGAMMLNYYYNGVASGSRWVGEDHGFFLYAAMTEAKPRFETRCRLKHVGSFEYGYPDQIPGFQLMDEEPVGQ